VPTDPNTGRLRLPPGIPSPVAPTPQPEHDEPPIDPPGPGHLSARDARAIALRTAKEAYADNLPALASAVAYRAFVAIPAALLAAVGVFGLVATPATVGDVIDRLLGELPPDALALLRRLLLQVIDSGQGSLVATAVGTSVAAWTLLSSMTTLMWALNMVYERQETRSFLRQRATALLMVLLMLLAVLLTFGLLVLGPYASSWVGRALGVEDLVSWGWWFAQWPIQIVGLLAAFSGLLYLGPDVDHPRWRFITPGSVFALVAWLATSAAFAYFASQLDSLAATWGSLSTVIVLLTWLWMSSLVLLAGAELNAEAERSRELRRREPARYYIQAPARGD
jgi:membrane protein